ncbi:MAG: sigma-54-dependent Fis family transcriptional regulator [Planctomycetales bacterium]|nr:sigma-54-dependent Fis family transcriptional regulator [Planctomycetales bacterium]
MHSIFDIEYFIGESVWTRRVRQRITSIAKYSVSTLIIGQSGTGKQFLARSIHQHSDRRHQPFVPLRCASIPASFFAAQLLGHEKGAFPGAMGSSLGCLKAAGDGTVLLEDVDQLSWESQTCLVEALQSRRIRPVGSSTTVPLNARIIATASSDLEDAVQGGRFRQDLYDLLAAVTVETAALVDRTEDVEPLVDHFLAKICLEAGLPWKTLSPSAMAMIQSYAWPENLDGLQAALERAVCACEDDVIGPEHFAEFVLPEWNDTAAPWQSHLDSFEW